MPKFNNLNNVEIFCVFKSYDDLITVIRVPKPIQMEFNDFYRNLTIYWDTNITLQDASVIKYLRGYRYVRFVIINSISDHVARTNALVYQMDRPIAPESRPSYYSDHTNPRWVGNFTKAEPTSEVINAVIDFRNKTMYTIWFDNDSRYELIKFDALKALKEYNPAISSALFAKQVAAEVFDCGYDDVVKTHRIINAINKPIPKNEEKDTTMSTSMLPVPYHFMARKPLPMISTIFYNEPYTTVKWADGTETTVGCAEGETFSKELGLSVAIAEKYLENLGFPHPRAALKHISENGHDQTAKTKARRAYKEAKKAARKKENPDG